MDTELYIVIEQYEAELERLQQLVGQNVSDGEYLMAHHHTSAMTYTQQTLSVLKRFDDVLWWRKELLKQQIARIEKEKWSEDPEKKFDPDILQRMKKELSELMAVPKKPIATPSLNVIEFTVTKLMQKEFRDFNLLIDRDHGFVFRFSYPRKVLKVKISDLKKHVRSGLVNEPQLICLKNIGFAFNEKRSAQTLLIPGEPSKQMAHLHIILLKCFFEIFYHITSDRLAFIEIAEPDNP